MQLTITGLSKTYPNGVQALKGVDLTKSHQSFTVKENQKNNCYFPIQNLEKIKSS